MMQKTISILLLLFCSHLMYAQSWDHIQNSGEYYYGLGKATSEAEASEAAIAELVKMIVEDNSDDFEGLVDKNSKNGNDHKAKVENCMNTYVPMLDTMKLVNQWSSNEVNGFIVRRYMKRSDLEKVFDKRITKAKEMVRIAQDAENNLKMDLALQYYYWAYSMINSTQFPNKVENEEGKLLTKWIPSKIEQILKNIKITVDKHDGEFVHLKIQYDGHPISSLEFNYFNGEKDCFGSAKDGFGVIEMAANHHPNAYKLNIEYQYKELARGDVELSGILSAVPHKEISKAAVSINSAQKEKTETSAPAQPALKIQNEIQSENQTLATAIKKYKPSISRVISSISSKRYTDAVGLFTPNGLDIYKRLVQNGTARIVGTPDLRFSQGPNGTTVVRGLQMSFSFENGKRIKTFVEDVVFTLDAEGKIDNLAFGLGKKATNDILGRYAPGWTNDTREMLIEFLENYKTAYGLKRLDYISNIFAEDAIIIIGNMTKVSYNDQTDGQTISVEGQEKFTRNRISKNDYLKRLETCFNRNEFINIRFSKNDIQHLDKYKEKDLYAIQICQEYNSSSYSDKGYLFLLVDMTKREAPLIKIRTWQPNEVETSKLYNAGDFYNE